MKKIIWILTVLCLIIYLGNYRICEYVYGNDLDSWWRLRNILFSLNFMFFSIILTITTKSYIKTIFRSLTMFCVADIIDRMFFNINTFTYSDWILLVTIVIITINNLNNDRRRKW